MKKNIFQYSLNFKVFSFAGAVLLVLLFFTAFAIRFNITEISIYWWILSLIVIFGAGLGVFIYFITLPLEQISAEILALLTGKTFKKIPAIRNDEIGVITHFFNTVTEKIKGLSDDLSEGKRMSSELELAAQIQSDVLPKNAPENIVGLDIVAKSRASSEVGGDCFDFLQQKDNTLIYIGDVTGHGVPAGLIMMLVSTTIKSLISENIPAKESLVKTNQLLVETISSNHFMSLVMLKWDNIRQKMSFIGAGHEYIFHYSLKKKSVQLIKSGGIALKMVPNISKILQETEIDFEEGDSLLLYTDGITEAKNITGEMYGTDRLKSIFLQNAYRKAADIFDKVTDDFSKFLGKNHIQEDDITMIIIKNMGQFGETRKIELSINAEEESKAVHGETWDWT